MIENSTITMQNRQAANTQFENGSFYRSAGDLVRARRYYRQATKLDPANERASGALAKVLEIIPERKRIQIASASTQTAQPSSWLNWKPISLSIILMLGLGLLSGLIVGAGIFGYLFNFNRPVIALTKSNIRSITQQISVKQGGTLYLNQASFTIPANSLTQDASFSLKALDQAPASSPDSSLVALGLPVQLETQANQLKSPSIISLKYDSDWLRAGISDGSLIIGRWDNGQWDLLESAIDTKNQVVSAKILHFSSPIIQLFGRSNFSAPGLTADAKKADDLLSSAQYAAASQSYQVIVNKYTSEQQKLLSKADASVYWLAYYNLGLSLRKQDQIIPAGKVFTALVKDAASASPGLINQDGSGPALALTALKNWYPLGMDIAQAQQFPLWSLIIALLISDILFTNRRKIWGLASPALQKIQAPTFRQR